MTVLSSLALSELSKKELEILQYVHTHSQQIPSMSIQEFAKEVNYSTSTVLRFCKKCGFSGFPELKYELRKEEKKIEKEEVKSNYSFAKIKSAIAIELDGTTGLLNSKNLVPLFDLLLNNPKIYIHKPGGLTDITLDYLESILFMAGCHNVFKSSANKMTRHLIHTVEKGSIFLFISNSGNFSPTLNIVKEAKLCGMTVISVSSIENNDIAELSDYSIRMLSRKREYGGADLSSRLSTYLALSSIVECFYHYKKGIDEHD